MLNYENALSFIFDHSFNEATEFQDGQKGVDQPMVNFLICIFRDKIKLTDAQGERMKKKCGLMKSAYEDAALGYLPIKMK